MQETVDVLNREQFIDMLYQLVNTMSDLKQGKIFSIDGTWGYGKTYVLEELERRLSPVVNEDTYDDKFYVFHYNCWQYDYYEEPSVAIISAMLEDSENSLEHRINEVAKAGWETAKTEAKFSKLVAPNKYEEISFDDFVMFSRSCVELATYIFEKMAYDYTKIALDIPDKQISKWRKYSKNRQEKALCLYIKTLYKVDEEFIEQIPKLLNMIIDPIV